MQTLYLKILKIKVISIKNSFKMYLLDNPFLIFLPFIMLFLVFFFIKTFFSSMNLGIELIVANFGFNTILNFLNILTLFLIYSKVSDKKIIDFSIYLPISSKHKDQGVTILIIIKDILLNLFFIFPFINYISLERGITFTILFIIQNNIILVLTSILLLLFKSKLKKVMFICMSFIILGMIIGNLGINTTYLNIDFINYSNRLYNIIIVTFGSIILSVLTWNYFILLSNQSTQSPSRLFRTIKSYKFIDNIEYLYRDIDILNNLFLTIITILVGFIIKWQVVDFQIDLIFRIAILIYILVTINIAFSIKKYNNIFKNTPRFRSLIRNNVFSYIIVTAIFFILPFVLYKSIFGSYIKIDLVELLISQLTAFLVGVTIYNPKSNIFLQTFVAFIPIFLILVLEQFTRINISNTVIDLSKSIIILFSIVAIVKKLFFK